MTDKAKKAPPVDSSELPVIKLSQNDANKLDDIQDSLMQIIDMMKRAEQRRRAIDIC